MNDNEDFLIELIDPILNEFDSLGAKELCKLIAFGEMQSGKPYQVQIVVTTKQTKFLPVPRSCRKCGCTDNDCSQCIKKTGKPCYWVKKDLCSACV